MVNILEEQQQCEGTVVEAVLSPPILSLLRVWSTRRSNAALAAISRYLSTGESLKVGMGVIRF